MKFSIALWALAVSARPNHGSSDTSSVTQPSNTRAPTATAVAARRDGLTSTMSDFPGTPMCDTTIVLTAGIYTTVVMPLPCSDLTTSTTAAAPTQTPAAPTSAGQTPYDFTGTTWSLSSLSTTSYGVAFPTPTFDESAMPYPTSMFPKSKTSGGGGGSNVATSVEMMMLGAAAMHNPNHDSSTAAVHNRFTDRACGSTKISLTQGVHTTIWMPLPCTTTEPAAFETSSVCSKLVTLTAGIHTVLTMPYPCYESGALHPITFSAPSSREGMLVADRTSFVTLLRTAEATA